ncbi:carbohydrate-binding family 9-like protein [Saccharicrinis sp. 156]|uniref:carbohydrate-binding family 9-like protein n=1 Tax=Saccharicrinis sp. 156 TaxID=3417574 RepID=UPI003D35725F
MNLKLQRYSTIGLILVFNLCYSYCQNPSGNKKNPIKVLKATSPIIIDGRADESSWQRAQAHPFNYFKNIQKPSDKQNTTLKMLWDDDHIYLFYECKDKYITARMKDRDGWTFVDDCAEIFLIPSNDKIDMHFGFELNLYKTANDFVFINDVHKDGNFVVKAYNPEYKVEVTIDGTINDNSDIDNGWTMEMAIPIEAFYTVGPVTPVEEGAIWTFMAIRQDRNEVEGQRVTASTIFPLKGNDKNVHNPKSFGLMQFVNE